MLGPDSEQIFRLIEHHAVLTALCAFLLIGITKLILQELRSVVVLYRQLRAAIRGEKESPIGEE